MSYVNKVIWGIFLHKFIWLSICDNIFIPGQFGTPRFNSAVFVGFLISVITSVIESVGDYIATSRVCHAYPVPRHAMNRGIAVEGIFSVISGAFGTAHATTSYSTTVSLLGLTKVCLIK